MQQDADFITADFLDMFRASCAHRREYKILTRQPPVQVVMVAGGSSFRHIRDETVWVWEGIDRVGSDVSDEVAAVLVSYTPDDGRTTAETCREKSASCCITSVFINLTSQNVSKSWNPF